MEKVLKPALVLMGVGILIASGLTGCANRQDSPDYKQLAKDCGDVSRRLVNMATWPTELEEAEFASYSYIQTVMGEETRSRTKRQITSRYPFLEVLALARVQGETEDQVSAKLDIVIIEESTLGTAFENQLTQGQRDALLKGEPSDTVYWIPTFGEFNQLGEESTLYDIKSGEEGKCIEVYKRLRGASPAHDEPDLHEMPGAARAASSTLSEMQSILEIILGCEQDGGCAGSDYVSSTDYSGSPTLRDPFSNPYPTETTQVLAEISWCTSFGLRVNAARTACE